MIPDFKTYIKESIWSDIQKRSAGETVRREDDVNHMNFDTFADYIRDNYSEKGNWFSVAESDDGKSRHIEIDIIYRGEIDLSFNVVEGKIYNILVQGNKNYVDIPGLKEIFNVNRIGSSTFGVYEKNWTISNNTFVKLIEFFLKKKTNESIWSDIQKRSTGETVRKEDDIDLLYPEEFVEYLKKHYIYQKRGSSYVGYVDDELYILFAPTKKYGGNYTLSLDYKRGEITFAYDIQKIYPEIFEKLNDRFKLTKVKHRFTYYAIEFDREATNSLFLEVVDFIVDMNDENILLKRR